MTGWAVFPMRVKVSWEILQFTAFDRFLSGHFNDVGTGDEG